MNIELKKVTIKERKKLENLLQLYLHDLSLLFSIPFNSTTCEYEYDLNKYFKDDYAYFIKSDKDILGFILIDNNLNNNYEISEIFVLNNYKGKKVGETAVKKVFDLYKGNWTIKAVPLSPVAEAFWEKTISKYTNGNFQYKYTGKYNRLEIHFTNK